MTTRAKKSEYARLRRRLADEHNRRVFKNYLRQLNSEVRQKRLKRRLSFKRLIRAYPIPHPYSNDLNGTRYICYEMRILRRPRDDDTETESTNI